MLDLNLTFQHFVNAAGIGAAIVVIGLATISTLAVLYALCREVTRAMEEPTKAGRDGNHEETISVAEYLHMGRIF